MYVTMICDVIIFRVRHTLPVIEPLNCITWENIYRARQKSNPLEKILYPGIVANIFTNFAQFTDEDAVHMACQFFKNNTCDSIDTTV